MIRHLTSKSNYESIIKDGVIKPRKKKIEILEWYHLKN